MIDDGITLIRLSFCSHVRWVFVVWDDPQSISTTNEQLQAGQQPQRHWHWTDPIAGGFSVMSNEVLLGKLV